MTDLVLLDGDELELELRQFFLVPSGDVLLDEVVDVLGSEGLSGTARRDERSQGPLLYIQLLSDCASGDPVRWSRRRSGGWAFEPIRAVTVQRLLAERLDAAVLTGDEVILADGSAGPLRPDDTRFDLGLEHLVWITRARLEAAASVVAGRLGLPCVEAPLGGGSIVTVEGGEQRLLEEEIWAVADGVVLWRTPGRRGFSVRRRRRRADFSWDCVDRRIQPPATEYASGPVAPGEVLDELLDVDLSFAQERAALEVPAAAVQRLRVLLRRAESDESTFTELLRISGLPEAAADVVEGRTSVESLPGARVRPPLSAREAVVSGVREEWASAAPGYWHRFGDSHPLWFSITSAVVVLGCLALVVVGVLTDRGVTALLPLAAVVIWTWSFVRWLRRRALR